MTVLAYGLSVADAATVSVRAVKVNDVAIPATNNVTVAPNDTITADLFVSGWGAELPGGVRTFQIQFAGIIGVQSGDNGTVLPLGWDGPVIPTPCATNDDCLDTRYPICQGVNGCRGAAHNPALGVLMDRTRADFMLFQQDGQFVVDTSSLNYRFTGIAEDSNGVTLDTGVARYCGTITMRVSANACGLFVFGVVPSNSLLADGQPDPNSIQLNSTPLNVTVSNCALQLVDCDPDHETIDARRPHPLDNTNRETLNQIVAHFSGPTAGLTSANFAISQVPNQGVIPGFASVVPSGNDATITLNRRLNFRIWTCIRHILSNKQCCFGVLPGDADISRVSQPADLFEIIDNLNGGIVPTLPFERCDMDRSNLCVPADLLTLVDLLNGAQAFDPYNGASLPPPPPMVIR